MKRNKPRAFIIILFLFATFLNLYLIFGKDKPIYYLVEIFYIFLLLVGIYRTSKKRRKK
ncbi:hypothetical protein ABID29_001379 [Streptococcus rupicaprae]|uniref:Immunity protein n=1 Tax=Streptococcus rupicaprae TaxID=759619 RepID=A0ABV2FI82_9STRE